VATDEDVKNPLDALRAHPERFQELTTRVGAIRLAELGVFLAALVERRTPPDLIIVQAQQAFGDVFEVAVYIAHSHPAEPAPMAPERP